MQNKRILILGAGPVGLCMAIGLAKKGLSSIVLEKRSSFEMIPKASTIHAPTMEIFEEWGVIDKILNEGLAVHEIQYWDRATNKIIANFNLDLLKDETTYPFRLQLEQSRIQQIFEEHYLDSNLIDLRFNHSLKSFEQTEDQVIATIEGNGEEFQLTTDVLIGADGASSTVRKLMNVEYEGFTYDKKFLVIGVIDHDFKKDHPGLGDVSYFFDSKEFLALIHNHHMWKFMFNLDSSIKSLDDISEDFMQAKIKFFSNAQKKFNIAHKTVFNVHQRVAKNIFDQRVILIGDAAHVNNPLGGMGMNSGIHDAYFLANDLKTLYETNFTNYEKVLTKFQNNREKAIQAVQRRTVENEKSASKSGNENPLEKMIRISSDPVQAKNYLMQSSMIDDFNLMKQLNSTELNV